MKSGKHSFFIVLIIIAGLTYLAFWGFRISDIGVKGSNFAIKGASQMRYGIDINGGVEAVYTAKEGHIPTPDELASARQIMEKRLDARNITDREITIDKANHAILVRFPWQSGETEFDANKAIAELGETARLTFRNEAGDVLVEGSTVKRATPEQNPDYGRVGSGTSRYLVALEFNDEGTAAFAAATSALVGKSLMIYMDDTLFSAPVVQQAITGGTATMTGSSTMAEAKELADTINSGSLPFSMESKSNSTISPTLGQSALNVMLYAGLVAFAVICLFMILYYRLPGFIACFALLMQVMGQMLALSIPQFTLTLPGIAAIILSIGIGVDANIITSERIKEELKSGKNLKSAINSGFSRAFSTVFDANMTSCIVAIILMIFGSGLMLSFGYSLLMGSLLNTFVGITIARIMTKSLSQFKLFQNPWLYGGAKK